MEAMLLSPTPDQSISHYYSKRNRNPRRIMFHSFISRPSLENLSVHGGLIGPPPSISSILSHPPPPPPPPPPHHHHHHHHHHQQIRKQLTPPLLPLPISPPPPLVKSRYSSLPSRTATTINNIMIDNANSNTSICSVQANRKTNSKSRGGGGGGGGGVDVAAKKPRSSPRTRKQLSHESSDRLGPDPRDLPKKVLLVSNSVADHESVNNVGVGDEEFSCSIFSLAPPPSSLPLPRFSLKPKLGGCNVVDAGATDNLRRLLRLR